jgi:hypothetical protein
MVETPRLRETPLMNTANLQIEGLLVAVSALMEALRARGALTGAEIDGALAEAEAAILDDRERPAELSHAHVEAICFPVRYLRLANRGAGEGAVPSFTDMAARVGREKP